jgi:hypothetical protein
MKKPGLIILAIIAVAVIVLLIAIKVIEFTIGAILLGVAALILWGLWKWAKHKIEDE